MVDRPRDWRIADLSIPFIRRRVLDRIQAVCALVLFFVDGRVKDRRNLVFFRVLGHLDLGLWCVFAVLGDDGNRVVESNRS